MKSIWRKFDILYHLQEPDDFEPVDNCITSVLGQEVELTDEFKANYEKWLDREVFGTNIQWEQLLGNKHLYCWLYLAVVYLTRLEGDNWWKLPI